MHLRLPLHSLDWRGALAESLHGESVLWAFLVAFLWVGIGSAWSLFIFPWEWHGESIMNRQHGEEWSLFIFPWEWHGESIMNHEHGKEWSLFIFPMRVAWWEHNEMNMHGDGLYLSLHEFACWKWVLTVSGAWVCMELVFFFILFVLCMSLHGEESILAMSVVLICLAESMEMFGFFA